MAKAKIFIVEDEVLIADEVSASLVQLGYDVCGMASKGEVALEKIEILNPEIVLCDIRLAGKIDGIEVADCVRNRFGLPVVYLTAHADAATLERAKVTQPYGYVLKPASDLELQTALELALYRHRAEKHESSSVEEEIAGVSEPHIEDIAVAENYEALRAITSLAQASDQTLVENALQTLVLRSDNPHNISAATLMHIIRINRSGIVSCLEDNAGKAAWNKLLFI